MSTTSYAYPFDPSGTLASNKIQGERQTISAPNWSDFYFIVPLAGPFFRAGHRVVHHPSGRILAEGVDYLLSHRFHDASLACGKPIYGSITFFDKTLVGVVELEYQTLGGAWTITQQQITEILSNKLINPRITTWEQVVQPPFEFPIVDHEWDLVDMVGASELEAALKDIKEAILLSGEGGLGDHLADFNNPHQTTKAQVGLGLVANFDVATVTEAQQGTANNKYMTPLRTAQAITALAVNPLNNHLSDYNNPHQVTKEQVNLGLVSNFQVATQAEAEAGTLNTRYMTPLRTAQSVAAALAPVTAHINNTSNPHNTTKGQVGLGLVANYAVADAVAARAGTANDLYMTPLMVREAIAAQSGGDLVSHVNNQNNPHNVTAGQIGLGNVSNYATATQVEAQTGTANNLFMTPLRTAQAIQTLAIQPLTDHINNTSNPHNVTAAQVGLGNVPNYPKATTAQAQAGTSDAVFMTAKTVAEAIAALADPDGQQASIASHLADHGNPHAVTKAQVGLGSVDDFATASQAEALAGTANNLFMTPLRTAQLVDQAAVAPLNDHIARQDNPHAVTAEQVGAYTKSATDLLLQGKLGATDVAVNSQRVGGLTVPELVNRASIRFIYPAVNDRQADDGSGGTVTVNQGTTWTKIGSYDFEPPVATDPWRDVVFYATGGERRGQNVAPHYRVQLSLRDLSAFTVQQLSGAVSDLTFGVVYDATENKVDIYSKNPTHRNSLMILVASEAASEIFSPYTAELATDTEPSGIQYAQHHDYDGGSPTDDAQPGELFFGRSPIMTAEYEPGQITEWVNVVETTEDATEAAAALNPLKEDFHTFLASSAFGSKNRNAYVDDLDQWAWNNTDGTLEFTNEAQSLAGLRSGQHYTDYTFETEIGSVDGGDKAIGVCAAFVSKGGKDYGIYVLRTPGGLVVDSKAGTLPGGDIYKLVSVGYNLLQDDAISLGSISSGVKWGDGVVDADRDPALFDSGAGNWGEAGTCRIRVTRAGNTITIRYSDFGSTDLNAHSPIVIDLTSRPELKVFQGPTTYGYVSWAQNGASFKAITRPDWYVPYVHYQKDADGNDTSTTNRWNGASWISQPMNLRSSFIKPGRQYYSDINGRLYFARRDGTLRPMYIEIFTREDTTLLSP